MEIVEEPAAGEPTSPEAVLREFAGVLIRQTPRRSLSRVASSALRLLRREGPQRITVLAEREAVSQPAMTNLVQRLESQELVARSTDPHDSRAVLIAITEVGLDVLQAREKIIDDHLAVTFSQLSPEHQSQITAALPALVELTRIHDSHH